MQKKTSFIKSTLTIFICFYIINLILSYVIFIFVGNYVFNNNSFSDELLDFIFLLIIFVSLYYFNKKNKKIGGIKIKTSDLKLYPFLILVLTLTIFFRISIDPIIWIDKTFHFIDVPVNNNALNNTDFIENTLMFFSTVIFTPVIEETMFRGMIIKSLNNYKIRYKILISSILFSIMHLPTDINSFIIIFFLGIILGIIALKLGLIFAIFCHFIYNLIWYVLNINPENYWQVISNLDFNYIYWISILITLLGFLLILKKIWINKHSY